MYRKRHNSGLVAGVLAMSASFYWPAPAVNVQKHYGYAFQWFAMSALVVGLYVWFQLIRPQRVPQS